MLATRRIHTEGLLSDLEMVCFVLFVVWVFGFVSLLYGFCLLLFWCCFGRTEGQEASWYVLFFLQRVYYCFYSCGLRACSCLKITTVSFFCCLISELSFYVSQYFLFCFVKWEWCFDDFKEPMCLNLLSELLNACLCSHYYRSKCYHPLLKSWRYQNQG